MSDQGGHGQAALTGVAPRSRGGGEAMMVPPGEPRSYYGEPILAAPAWTWEVPVYFFVGGIAGAAAPLTYAARRAGDDALAVRSAAVALAGAALSPALLIADLGRPERFLYMLRVFKPTSPMSVGSWVLSAFSATAAVSALSELTGRLPGVARGAQAAGLVLGPLLSTYTAALIANTAVPVWHEARRELPFVFGAGAIANAGALLALITPYASARPAWRMAAGGALAGLASIAAMEARLGPAGEPYHRGSVALMSRAAQAATALGGLMCLPAAIEAPGSRPARPRPRPSRRAWARAGRLNSALPGTRRPSPGAARAGAVAVLAGGMLERWAIYRAGFASARDPRYVVEPQRRHAARSAAAGRGTAEAGSRAPESR